MKPKNFPERKNRRRQRAGSPNAVPDDLRGVRTKKQKPFSSARTARLRGKLS